MSKHPVIYSFNSIRCIKCGRIKHVNFFHSHSDGGIDTRCKDCELKREESRRRGRGQRLQQVFLVKEKYARAEQDLRENLKSCSLCGERKPLSEFYRDNTKGGFRKLRSRCKECDLRAGRYRDTGAANGQKKGQDQDMV